MEAWNAVNRISNCMTMDTTTHILHNNRLLAVHPDFKRIRLFAPIKPLMKRLRPPPGDTEVDSVSEPAVSETEGVTDVVSDSEPEVIDLVSDSELEVADTPEPEMVDTPEPEVIDLVSESE
ncbi:hypothetical protein V8E54_013521 [Elaphomyces granulatus]